MTKPVSKKKKPTVRRQTSRAATAEDSLLGRGDQIGATFAKGLDLAEASLSLGLTLINRFGTMVQDSVMEKVSGVMSPTSDTSHDATPPSARAGDSDEPAPSPESSEAMGEHDPAYYIVNPLPLTPGQPVQVSFSINNDSMEASKRVTLKVDGFTEATQGHTFSSNRFTVTPKTRTILPMDFEKFVLKGVLPKDILPGVYIGRILVIAELTIEIPVRLFVTSAS